MGAESSVEVRSNCMQTIEEEHSMIHAGKLFSYTQTVTALAAAGTKSVILTVPTGLYPHVAFSIVADQPTQIDLFTGSTSTPGANVVGKNRNQASGITPLLGIDATATGIGDGTALSSVWLPGSTYAGGAFRNNLEWILNSGVKYSLKVTNKHASTASNIYIEILWYEL